MKRKQLLSLTLTLALVFTTVFSGTESIFAGTAVSAFGGTVTSGGTVKASIEAQDVNKVTDSTTVKYTAKMTTGTDNIVIIPVTTTKGGTICVPLTGMEVGMGVSVSLHSTAAATSGDTIGYDEFLYSSTAKDTLYAKVSKAGTYYLKFETAAYSAGVPQSVDFSVLFYPNGGTVTKGKTFYGASPENDQVSYYKVTVPGNGYLTVSFPERLEDYASYSIKLTNSKKNSLFPSFEYISSSDGYKTQIGVKKGTYYVAVKSYEDAYGIKISFTSVTENSGTTKSKAKSITKGSTKKGIITVTQNDSSGDWYKFKITKTQYVKFNVTTLSSGGGGFGGLTFAIYQAGRSYPFFTESLSGNNSVSIQPYTYGSGTKLKPGTYYIKVSKYSYGNGYYKIKWLK